MVIGVVADPRYLGPDLTLVITNKYREPNIYRNMQDKRGRGRVKGMMV